MKYGFVNNFKQQLAAGISSSDTTMTLDGGGSDLDSASPDFVYSLTLIELNGATEVDWEVVHVTGVSSNDLTIERGKDGTSARSWDADTVVELRLPAEILTKLLDYWGDDAGNDSVAILDSGAAEGKWSVAISYLANAVSESSLAVGSGSYAPGVRGIAVGGAVDPDESHSNYSDASNYVHGAYASGEDSTAVGTASKAQDNGSVAIGSYTNSSAFQAVAFGSSATASADWASAFGSASTASGASSIAVGFGKATSVESVSVGEASEVYGDRGIALGSSAIVGEDGEDSGVVGVDSIAIGSNALATGGSSVALGRDSSAQEEGSVSLGAGAEVGVKGGARINALQYLPAVYQSYQGSTSTNSVTRSSSQVVIATDAFDLTDDTASVTLDLPSGTMLFIDAIDVVVTGSDGAGGSPEITVGPDDQDPADYLAATGVGKTSVGGRETHEPLVGDGVTSVRVAISTAGTGTTYEAKIVLRGYVMEL